jgi:hypothetical protein
MHIVLEDQTNGSRSVLCIERGNRHCEIIVGNIEHVHKLEQIAASQGVDTVYAIVTPAQLENWEAQGWMITEAVVVAKQLT